MTLVPDKTDDPITNDHGYFDGHVLVTMVNAWGIVVYNTEAKHNFCEIVTKKWERVQDLLDRWEPIMEENWQIIVDHFPEAASTYEFTKKEK